MASSSLKVPVVERASPSIALKRLIDAECEKYKTGEKSAIDGRIFIPRRHAQQDYVLGPIFKEIPIELPALYLRKGDNGLLDLGTELEDEPTPSLLAHSKTRVGEMV